MQFKTTPFKHQLEEWEASRSMPTRALFWEMGTGKTKLVIDTAAWLREAGEIDGMLVLAPNGVHDAWILDELPTHMTLPYWAHAWRSGSAATKWHAKEVAQLTSRDGLVVLAMSYDGFMTKRGHEAALKFLDKRRCLFVADEVHRLKTPSAKRTRAAVYAGRRAQYKRILTGTPVTNSPFDVYCPLKFLDENFWKPEFASYESFKTYFGVWEERVNSQTGGRFSQVVSYRNIDQLAAIVDRVSSRVTKDQVLDLPPKVYKKVYFEMAPEQARVYEAIKNDMVAFLNSGEVITTPLVIVQLMRLQQVTCGYVPSDGAEALTRFDDNPRLKCLLEVLEDSPGQAIVFARFREDINQICAALGADCVRYDGAVEQDARVEARRRFQDGSARYFVGNPAAAGVGLTLTAAKTVVYYSNNFSLEQRLQSEDRAHRIGQSSSVTYIDVVARGTVDSRIVKALRDKLNIASQITGDEVRKWL